MAKIRLASWGKYILLAVVAGVLLAALSWLISTQLQEMQAPLRQNETVIPAGGQSRPGRETVAYYWDPELLVAQQLDRVMRLNRPDSSRAILESIEQNIPYNRNKPAAYFYLAEAYLQQGNPEKAQAIYQTVLDGFNNRNVLIYPAAQGVREDTPGYSVSLREEAVLRLYFLTGDTAYLDSLLASESTFGPENKPGFLYADLAAVNLAEGAPVSSYAFLAHLARAEDFLRRYIQLIQEDELPAAGQMVSGGAGRTLALDVARIKALKYQDEPTLTLEEIRKDRDAYLYDFLYNEADLRFTLRGSLDDLLVIERVRRGQ
ncbi:MAG: tetratricopeptide repeat protein [Candidatus Margulisbacteria bacterium]|jgi:tetratricopeptide (TPR) repeat protein|nr:tetratricopeptide repeat protein [Candidatus Margulisiibacteriota bacterium]